MYVPYGYGRYRFATSLESMSKNWSFNKPDLTVTNKSLMNRRDDAKTGHISLDFDRSFYADDAAFVFLSRAELIEGSTFRRTNSLGLA
jgi:hypothetical protein